MDGPLTWRMNDPWTTHERPTGNVPACRCQRDFASPTPNHLHSSGSKTDLLHSRHDPFLKKGHVGLEMIFHASFKSLGNEVTDRSNPVLSPCHSQESQTSTYKKDTCANQTYLSAGRYKNHLLWVNLWIKNEKHEIPPSIKYLTPSTDQKISTINYTSSIVDPWWFPPKPDL